MRRHFGRARRSGRIVQDIRHDTRGGVRAESPCHCANLDKIIQRTSRQVKPWRRDRGKIYPAVAPGHGDGETHPRSRVQPGLRGDTG